MRIGSVIAGGLSAGLWINLSGIAAVKLMLGPDYVRSLLALMPGPPGPATFVRHLGLRFALGIVGVALYATLRLQFGRSTTAALAAAAFLFFAAYVPLAAMLNEIGVLTGWRFWATLAWSAGEGTIGMLLGAFVFDRLTGSVP